MPHWLAVTIRWLLLPLVIFLFIVMYFGELAEDAYFKLYKITP
jgi:hypothetical protein